jgi:single-strand DNA-binding protein
MTTNPHVTIVGNLTRSPELRFTPSGVAVVGFGVAVNRRRQNDAGEWTDAGTEFYEVTAWRQLATNLAESLDKGTRVIIAGRLAQRSWETDAGERRTTVEIVADVGGPDLTWATASVQRNDRRGPESATGPTEQASV